MFDIGGWEFLLIVIIAVVVIGPKELPGAIRTATGFMRRARELAREFQSGLEEVAHQAELDKLKDEVKGMVDPGNTIGDLKGEIENAVDPDRELRHAMDFDREWRDDDLVDFSDAPDAAKAAPEKIAAPKPDAPAPEKPAPGKVAPGKVALPDEAAKTEPAPAAPAQGETGSTGGKAQ